LSDAGDGKAALPDLAMHAVVLDCAETEPLVAFWSAALGYVTWFEPFGQFAGLKPPPDDPRRGLALILQRVPEAKVVKNRAHVDYEAADRAADRAAEVERLVGLGGTLVREVDEGSGLRWTVMADPAGNEFCITQK
jgi:catechol 2,3-dioxygenase-like lactoylglutathione lyase family enzyme